MRTLLLPIAIAIGACAHHGSDPGSFDAIEVDPPSAMLTVQLGGTATQDYTVYGVSGGSKTDITKQCVLSIDPTFGSFAQATATVGGRGGMTQVMADCSQRTASADLVVTISGTIVMPGAPASAPSTFQGATLGSDPAHTPGIEYPIDHAVSPRNIPPIEIQWTAAANDLFHVALVSSYLAVDVYTTDVQATLASPDWTAIANTAAGAQLAITVEGLAQAMPQTKYASAAVTLVMSHDTIDNTAIYYWASSQGSLMTETFGSQAAPTVVKDDCTSCHAVSRTGSRIGYARCLGGDCNQMYTGFLRYDGTSWTEVINAKDRAIKGTFSTFAPVGNPFPDDTKSAAIVSMQTGNLALYDPDTAAVLPSNLDVANHGPNAPRTAMMADWSADGTKVVFTSTPTPGQIVDIQQGSIAIMDYAFTGGAHTFSEPRFIVANPITLATGVYTNFFFPSFSPDGALIVFNAARGAWRNFTDAAAAGQRLMITDANGSFTTELSALNGGNVDADITWPHWAPSASNDYYWIVFSSERNYGHEITATHTAAGCISNAVKQCKQIWIGAIAKNQLGTGGDPSAPPMWLPGQDPGTDNISPYWSLPAAVF